MLNHMVIDNFFVIDLDDMEVVLGRGHPLDGNSRLVHTSFHVFSFEVYGKKVVMRGVLNRGPKEISTQ